MFKILRTQNTFTMIAAAYILALSLVIVFGETFVNISLGFRLFKWEVFIGVNDHKGWTI